MFLAKIKMDRFLPTCQQRTVRTYNRVKKQTLGKISLRDRHVGFSNTPTSIHAFLWSRQNGIEDLGTLPGDISSKAYAINDAEDVVGSSSGPAGIRAFFWTRSSGMKELTGLQGATYTEAFAINNSGEVVGASPATLILSPCECSMAVYSSRGLKFVRHFPDEFATVV
jgi:hypothetical protein